MRLRPGQLINGTCKFCVAGAEGTGCHYLVTISVSYWPSGLLIGRALTGEAPMLPALHVIRDFGRWFGWVLLVAAASAALEAGAYALPLSF
jgi:hypothetical protein